MIFDVRIILAAFLVVGMGIVTVSVAASDKGAICETSILNGTPKGC